MYILENIKAKKILSNLLLIQDLFLTNRPKVLVSEANFFSAWKLFSKALNLRCVAAESELIFRVIRSVVSEYEQAALTNKNKITRRIAEVALIAFEFWSQRF